MSDGDLRPLPILLRPGLRLVFVGYNPGITSARLGHYYAHPGNAFWRHLNESGLVPRPVGHEDDRRLADEAGIGFVDLCRRPTLRAEELAVAEIEAGARRLLGELEEYQPGVAVFSGKGIYQHFGAHALGLPRSTTARRAYGEQPERVGGTRIWVVPSSSGLASRWHRERLALLRKLAGEMGTGSDQ